MERHKTMTAKVMDALCKFTRHVLRSDDHLGQKLRVDILDTKFVSNLTRLYPKFSKAADRSAFQFPKALVDMLEGVGELHRIKLYEDADIVYIPFNFDRKHWVAAAINLTASKIEVLELQLDR